MKRVGGRTETRVRFSWAGGGEGLEERDNLEDRRTDKRIILNRI